MLGESGSGFQSRSFLEIGPLGLPPLLSRTLTEAGENNSLNLEDGDSGGGVCVFHFLPSPELLFTDRRICPVANSSLDKSCKAWP